ncbi:dienelactone hydrolase family protein [Alicyclobacillus cycloheptanicus]|uniref:Carboxymethylenebutenolidase n=1 Tax=Alicyclobacillus cycloheptanicus TaxID=1457 RepID=A0ABT9XGM2_9BACL|nr:dienelactone hydrolase family protein [Alicyclobacillus cycloheptanicus]MDQ0189214.1 carboxymethylenebutenolidase [Alicyclobacillus cycloheptanicus]WDM00399.1 dienelactone hydrolase family protein [Alicyclobacillus cycloheptanicus]
MGVLKTEWVTYGNDGQYVGYAARLERAQTPLPAVIVFQEIWGVDEHIIDVTNRFAEAGYVAFAPDLYAQNGKRPEVLSQERISAVKDFLNSLPPSAWGNPSERDAALAKLPADQQKQVGETFGTLFGGLQMEKYVDQIKATAAFLRSDYAPSKGQGVASVGYCMGGSLSALLACNDPQLKGAVLYYGSVFPSAEQLANVTCPLLGFYGEQDHGITAKVPDFAERVKQSGKSFEYHVYEGAGHAFFNDGRPSYHATAARDAFARTLDFFNRVLA